MTWDSKQSVAKVPWYEEKKRGGLLRSLGAE